MWHVYKAANQNPVIGLKEIPVEDTIRLASVKLADGMEAM